MSGIPVNTAPQAVTATAQTVTIQQPTAQGQFGAVVIANLSPYICSVDTGQPGQWLQAWSADVFAVPIGTNPLKVTTGDNTTGTGVSSGSVTASWYYAGDTIPGVYPISLTAQAVAATLANSELLAATTVTINGTGTVDITIPAGIQSIAVFVSPTGAVATATSLTFDVAGDLDLMQTGVPLAAGSGQTVYGVTDVISGSGTVTLTISTSPSENLGNCTVVVYGFPQPAAQLLGRFGAPVHTTSAAQQSAMSTVTLAVTAGQLVAPPDAGWRRIVEAVSIWNATNGDVIAVGINSSSPNFAFTFETTNPPFCPGWIIWPGSLNGIWVANNNAARGFAYATYHDEPL